MKDKNKTKAELIRELETLRKEGGESAFNDITERKQAEEEIKSAAAKWQTTFNAMNDAVTLIDNNGIVLQCNQSYLNSLGKTETEILGKHCWEIIHGTNKPIDGCPYVKMKKSFHRESLLLPVDDKWFNVIVDPIFDTYNNLISAVHIMTDITERKQAEERLKKYQDHLEEMVKERTIELEENTKSLKSANLKLQELNRLKSMFVASMSHELRTPLNSIIGFTGIILQGKAGKINEEQRKQLTMVQNSANHFLNLINDVLDTIKIEAGEMELCIKEFDLAFLSQEVMNSFTVAAEEKGLKLLFRTPSTLLVKSDKQRTKQILVNFISNALKFTDRGKIEIKIVKKDESAEISVRDTGSGIKREDMDKLFKAFSRIGIKGRIEEGTGLGLYISKKIADLLGGDITVESEFGKGSVFTFILPLEQ